MSDTRPVVAAVDIGGTGIKSALVSTDLDVVVESTEATPAALAGAVGETVAAIVARLQSDAGARGAAVDLVGCGVVVPGIVDESAQVAKLAVNLGWHDLRIADEVARVTGLPAVLGHDVRAALQAESRLGAARAARHAMLLVLGTGIAAALMVDGRVLNADGWAGELGHVVLDPAGPACACGARGCLEAIASASAVARAYAGRTGSELDARAVAELVDTGDPVAVEVWREAVEALARGVVGAVALTGVDLVVVGGGLAQSGELLLAPLRAAVAEQMTFHRPPRIERAALGDRAGCLGAADLAWRTLRGPPRV